ncbi:MAG: hypothetical protein IT295_06635 [Dehalococcoidia bacterium]|nr:hypothetical protein [Dehalococcoidia bacterium]
MDVRQIGASPSLGEKYTPARLDAACARALDYELIDVRRLQYILLQAIECDDPPASAHDTTLGTRFARPGAAFDRRQQEVAG